MKIIQSIIAKLEQDADLNVIRCAIADLIIHYSEYSKTMNNLAALDHLINAVGSLTLNINATRQPSALGLKVCMVDIEKAITELSNSTETYQVRARRVEALSFDLLLEAAHAIHKKVCRTEIDVQLLDRHSASYPHYSINSASK